MDRQDNRNNSFICTLQLVDIISANKCRVDTDCPPGQPCNNEGQCVEEGFFEADYPVGANTPGGASVGGITSSRCKGEKRVEIHQDLECGGKADLQCIGGCLR